MILFVSVTTMIGYLQFFEEPFVMTNGGPSTAPCPCRCTPTSSSASATMAAAALGYIIFVAVAVITFIQFRALRENT